MKADRPTDPKEQHRKPNLHKLRPDGCDSARQLMQPAPFRSAAPRADDGPAASGTDAQTQNSKTASTDEQLRFALRTLATVATAVWRAKTKLDTESQGELPDGLRNVPRHIQAAWDALAAGRVQIDDPTGKPYVTGMAVSVLTFQPIDGIGSEIIHETIKPSVYFDNRLIQRADVIVARPVAEPDKARPNDVVPMDVPDQDNSPEKKGNGADDADND